MEEAWEGVEFVAWTLKRQELGAETGFDWPVRGSAFKTGTKLHTITKLPFTKTILNKLRNLDGFHIRHTLQVCLMIMICFISSNTSKPCLRIIAGLHKEKKSNQTLGYWRLEETVMYNGAGLNLGNGCVHHRNAGLKHSACSC